MKRTPWMVVPALFVAIAAQAQDSADRDSLARPPVEPPPSTKPTTVPSLTGYVLAPDGTPHQGAIVTATPADSGKPRLARVDTSDAGGAFRFDSLAAGTYSIQIDYSAPQSYKAFAAVNGEIARTFVLPAPSGDPSPRQTWWTIFCLGLYGITILFARWHHIARSVHAIITRQLTALKTRLGTEVDGRFPKEVDVLKETVETLLNEEKEYAKSWYKLWEVLFWSRGHENATWIAIHEIERQLAAFIAPNEQVEVYLRWAEAELRQIAKPTAIAIADAIHVALEAPEAANTAEIAKQEKSRRALLGRAIAIAYVERDTGFSSLMEWQNKAGWLLLGAMIIIGFLTGAVGRAVLFLAGASGGFVSRVMRALKRDDVPLDYGASWATLFLSPLFGALMGWFGVALIVLAASPTLNLLGPAFSLVSWDNPYGAVTLAIAFILGFSERFFDAIVGAVEGQADRTRSGRAPGENNPPVAPVASAQAPPSSPSGKPVIIEITRQGVSTGASAEALLVRGTGFDKKATASINDAPRDVVFQSPEALLILLKDEDVNRIENAGDSIIVVANPGGAASAPTPFV